MPSTKPPPAKVAAQFCQGCGQPVSGEIATRAATPGIVHCCNCGLQLDPQGHCQNNACQFYGVIPQC